MKVKPFFELATILEKDPYYKINTVVGVTAFHYTGNGEKVTFLFDMFECCGKDPNAIGYSWEPEWLDESHEDYIGKICSVWDSKEPLEKENKRYQVITEYLENATYHFITKEDKWIYARPLTEKDLL